MRVKVLGSAAGGGFPQWNCACRNCRRLRDGSLRGRPRTQTQLAVSSDNSSWLLLNASPDLRQQILSEPEFAPSAALARAPIAGVILTSADVDCVMGLLHLREFQPFHVLSTPSVERILKKENSIFKVLNRSTPQVIWGCLETPPQERALSILHGNEPVGLSYFAVSLGGSYPDYVSIGLRNELSPEGAVVGLVITQGKKRVLFAPGLSGQIPQWQDFATACDLVLIDGTFWSNDELIQTGRSQKTAREIGHLPLSGPGGLLEQYPKSAKGRKVLIHINNTNPILDEESAEHRVVLDAGFEIAYDGMEFEL
jgi:pyrroloquinoline quinone biosynthesis protein B